MAGGLKGAGGMVYSPGGGQPRFTGVVPGSPLAIAGIKDNDLLISVEGAPVKGLNFHQLNALLLSPSGFSRSIKIKSGEVSRTVILKF